MLLIPVLAISQTAKVSTTDDEYNYLTKGYSLTLENGTDIKAGYELKQIDQDVFGDYSVAYSLFTETSTGKTKAVLITVKKEKGKDDKVRYLCLPIGNQDLLIKFSGEVEKLGISMKIALDASTYNTLSKAFDKVANKIKN